MILPDFDIIKEDKSVVRSSALALPTPATQTESKRINKAARKTEREMLVYIESAQRRAPRYIICMGLPGSGKSTFARCVA